MFEYLDIDKLEANEMAFKRAYHTQGPFNHVEIQELVRPEKLEQLAKAFPDEDWDHWNTYPTEHVSRTKVCEATRMLPIEISRLIFELNSGPFLRLLQNITGIDSLLPDPHLKGAGMHMTLPGGTLSPHVDHHIFEDDPRYRQLNLILYLTKGWSEGNQANFELWDRNCKNIEKEITPSFGNSLLFRTSDNSMHGFSKPVKHANRRSVALFYYTATSETKQYGGNAATYWQPQTIKPKNAADAVRLFLQRAMWLSARIFGKLSWLCQRSAMFFMSSPK